MNAYELAKQLEERHAPYEDDAANMLRQQADRIVELENAKQFIQNFAEEQHRRACALEESQTKPLSDEEMKELINNFPIIFSPQDLLSFARAIEERHGIK